MELDLRAMPYAIHTGVTGYLNPDGQRHWAWSLYDELGYTNREMNMGNEEYSYQTIGKGALVGANNCEPMTLSQQLDHRKAKLEVELADVNNAIAVLARNPGVVEAMDALKRVGHHY